jgi:hypothetical protein
VSLAAVRSRWAGCPSTLRVDGSSDRLQVKRTNARWPPAQMVKEQAIGDRPYQQLVDPSVRVLRDLVAGQVAVAVTGVCRADPEPAAGVSDGDLLDESTIGLAELDRWSAFGGMTSR